MKTTVSVLVVCLFVFGGFACIGGGARADVAPDNSIEDSGKRNPTNETNTSVLVSPMSPTNPMGTWNAMAQISMYKCIVYYDTSGKCLKYSLYSGGTWSKGTCIALTSPWTSIGTHASIAGSGSGFHVVCYGERPTGNRLLYTYTTSLSPISWQKAQIIEDSGLNNGQYSDIKVDPTGVGKIHVVYMSTPNFPLLMYRTAAVVASGYPSWSTAQTVDYSGDLGYWVSMSLDSAYRPHLSYYHQRNPSLVWVQKPRYAFRYDTNNTWASCVIPVSTEAQGGLTSISVDDTTGVHVSFYNYDTDSLLYQMKSTVVGGLWLATPEIVDYMGYMVSANTRLIATSKYVHICYYTSQVGNFKYAHKGYNEYYWSPWTTCMVPVPGYNLDNLGQFSSMIINSGIEPNMLMFSLYDGTQGKLLYTVRNVPIQEEDIDSIPPATKRIGDYNSVYIRNDNANSEEILHMAYLDTNINKPKYAWRSLSVGGSPWTITTITDTSYSSYGKWTEVVVDGAGKVFVVYTASNNNYANSVLRCWIKNGATTTIETVTGVGFSSNNYGYWQNGIAVDGLNYIYVSFYDQQNDCLRFARRDLSAPGSGIWTINPIDSTGGGYTQVGKLSSIAVYRNFPLSTVYVSYRTVNSGHGKLKCMRNDYGGDVGIGKFWALEYQDTYGDTAMGTSITVDRLGYAHIAYHREETDTHTWDMCLLYATNYYSHPGWNLYVIPTLLGPSSTDPNGEMPSIKVDDRCRAHISYLGRDTANNMWKLFYTYTTNPPTGFWSRWFVDDDLGPIAGGDLSMQTSLALDDGDGVHISSQWNDASANKVHLHHFSGWLLIPTLIDG